MPWPALLVVIVAGCLVVWNMLRKLGIGTDGGKPDCGCGSGAKCKSQGDKR